MPLPGTEVNIRDAGPPRSSAPTDTSAAFFVGFTDRGPANTGTKIKSMRELTDVFGPRVTFGLVYDAADAFFRNGGSTAFIGRVVGPAPVTATIAIPGTVGTSLNASAIGPGVYANTYKIRVDVGSVGGTYKIVVLDGTTLLETSPDLADQAAGAAWSQNSAYIRLAVGAGTTNPTTGATLYTLTGGTDDHANAVDAQWQAALDGLGVDLGPGQVLAPGRTTAVAHAQLLQHGADRNRFALLDAPDGSAVSALTTLAATDRALGSGSTGLARHGALFYPWVQIPGVITGTVRTVPYSAVEAGLIASVDALGNPNVPAAGDNGIVSYGSKLTATFTDAQRTTLNDAGVNVAKVVNGQIKTYGYRTLADPTISQWAMASNARLAMAIKAKAGVIAERFVLRQIDGEGTVLSDFNGQLSGMLADFYRRGALYGTTADDAFRVDTGPQVNTDASLAAGELHAAISVRMSPFAERVYIDVVKVAITESL